MNTNELREKYLEFFVSKGHARQPSDVLVPTWDPSVLFTPAGMNQFKDHFLGKVKLDFTRATTCQKCLRTGDIENVGRTAYHHTFFEMLGNFSFGDYFKREAIHWAWEFLTDKRWMGLAGDRLSISVYKDDDEAAEIWLRDIKISPARLERMGEDDNFWPAGAPTQGPDGVCGPCSEIFFHTADGGSVEIWNLVFTQFNRVGNPPNNLRPLPSKNIDTGMGLERMAATMQGVDSNFHIDILIPIVRAAAEVCGLKYDPSAESGRRLRRITDHVRACTMAIHENVYPGPNKEKYVIRRLLRRAVLDGHQLGMTQPFLYQLVPVVVQQMKVPYPELQETTERVAEVVKAEEANFLSTIDAGLARIERIFGEMERQQRMHVDGREIAELYQTYGVPPELFESMAAEKNLAVDWQGFRDAMTQHGETSGKIAHVVMGDTGDPLDALKKAIHETPFLGYEVTESPATIRAIIARGHLCDHVQEVGHDQRLIVVLDHTPFYGESGGQVGDSGVLEGEQYRFEVRDTQKHGALIVHHGHLLSGDMKVGDRVTARVHAERRAGIQRAHSATHILHHALQKQLGSHAQQQGSKVDEDWLRFDFTNMTAVAPEQLSAVQADMEQRIAGNEPIRWQIVPLAEARQAGAMMLFGEKYPDPVRMVSMGEFSRELCGGTHLKSTGEVRAVEILSEEGVAASTRRLVVLTGTKASEHRQQTRAALQEAARVLNNVPLSEVPAAARQWAQTVRELKRQLASTAKPTAAAAAVQRASQDAPITDALAKELLRHAARELNVGPFDVPKRLTAMRDEIAQLEQQVANRSQVGSVTAEQLLAMAEKLGNVHVVIAEAPSSNANLMRQLVDQVRKAASPCAVLLGAREGDSKVTLIAGVSRELEQQGVHAGNWVRETAQVMGGSGGGRADLAQAGGSQPDKLPAALQHARQWVGQVLTKSK